ncbi:MAG TPA: IclR family transcriptional regulator [Bryobacteraceae bacterium]|jgi:DNA-binding IclR family transcriptional regulator
MSSTNFVELVEKTMRTIDAVHQTGREATLSAIAARVGLVKSSTYRILFTLTQLGYLEKTESGSYMTTAKLSALTHTPGFRPSLISISRPHLQELRRKLQESVWLAEWRNGCVIMIDVAEGPFLLPLSLNIGDLCPLHASALGKAIAAYLSPPELDLVLGDGKLPRYTVRSISTRKELQNHLTAVRRDGYSINDGETAEGAFIIGAPVFDSIGTAFAAVSITAAAQSSSAKRKAMIGGVKAAAAAISEDLSALHYTALFRLSNAENRAAAVGG